jgi:hypothetical protein
MYVYGVVKVILTPLITGFYYVLYMRVKNVYNVILLTPLNGISIYGNVLISVSYI